MLVQLINIRFLLLPNPLNYSSLFQSTFTKYPHRIFIKNLLLRVGTKTRNSQFHPWQARHDKKETSPKHEKFFIEIHAQQRLRNTELKKGKKKGIFKQKQQQIHEATMKIHSFLLGFWKTQRRSYEAVLKFCEWGAASTDFFCNLSMEPVKIARNSFHENPLVVYLSTPLL